MPAPMSPVHSRWLGIGCAVALVISIFALHHEVLLGGRVYHMDDAADGYYPAHVAIARAYREGHLPTWERGSWAGWPLNVDPYYGPFYPLSAIFWIVGAARGLGWTIAVHMVGAALGMLWLLRRRKLDWGPALLGAASYGLSSFMVERIRHIIFAEGMAWLPFVLVGVEGWLQTRSRRELALVALAAGMAVLCGALPLVPYFVILVLAYALPRWLKSAERRPAAIGLGVAAGVGALVACAQLVPTMAHVPLSPRALTTDYHFAASYAWPEWKYLVTLVAPDTFGSEAKGAWFGAYNYWEMAGYYAGLVPLGLMLVGLFRRKPEIWALFGSALVAVVLAFGEKTPLHKLFFRFVPLFGTLRCPTRALILVIFAASLLGAEGLQWLLERPAARVRAIIGGAVALLGAGAAIWAVRQIVAVKLAPVELAERAALVQVGVVAALAGGLFAAWQAGKLRPQTGALLLAALTLGDLLWVDAHHVQPRPGDWAQGTDRFAAVDWLLAQHPTDRFVPAAQGPFRLHNVGMTYGLESAGGYDSVSVWRYVNLLQIINTGAPYPHDKLVDDLAAGTIKRFFSPLVDLLNVRWAIAPSPPAADWVERFRNDGLPHARHEAVWDPQLRVYENPHVMPRAFVVYRAETVADDAAAARKLARLDPRKLALVDRAPEPPPAGDDRPLTPARITLAERQRLVIEAEPTAPGILVVSETHYPGWSVTVDGRPAPLLRADYALRGVALPAGHHTVEMRFTSRPTVYGLMLSLVGLLGLAGLVARRRVLK
jgi:hypothetical protein